MCNYHVTLTLNFTVIGVDNRHSGAAPFNFIFWHIRYIYCDNISAEEISTTCGEQITLTSSFVTSNLAYFIQRIINWIVIHSKRDCHYRKWNSLTCQQNFRGRCFCLRFGCRQRRFAEDQVTTVFPTMRKHPEVCLQLESVAPCPRSRTSWRLFAINFSAVHTFGFSGRSWMWRHGSHTTSVMKCGAACVREGCEV